MYRLLYICHCNIFSGINMVLRHCTTVSSHSSRLCPGYHSLHYMLTQFTTYTCFVSGFIFYWACTFLITERKYGKISRSTNGTHFFTIFFNRFRHELPTIWTKFYTKFGKNRALSLAYARILTLIDNGQKISLVFFITEVQNPHKKVWNLSEKKASSILQYMSFGLCPDIQKGFIVGWQLPKASR